MPEEGLLLYSADRRVEFLLLGGVAVICSFAALGYSYFFFGFPKRKGGGYLTTETPLLTKVALGFVCFSGVAIPILNRCCPSWSSFLLFLSLSTPTLFVLFCCCCGRATAKRAVRRIWAMPSSPNDAVSSTLRIEPFSFFGGPGKKVQMHPLLWLLRLADCPSRLTSTYRRSSRWANSCYQVPF